MQCLNLTGKYQSLSTTAEVAVFSCNMQHRKVSEVVVFNFSADFVYGGSVIFTGVYCRCVVPSVTVNTPVLNLGHCFLGHPYQCHVELFNGTDLPAKYELLTCSAVDGLDSVMFSSPQPQVCHVALSL